MEKTKVELVGEENDLVMAALEMYQKTEAYLEKQEVVKRIKEKIEESFSVRDLLNNKIKANPDKYSNLTFEQFAEQIRKEEDFNEANFSNDEIEFVNVIMEAIIMGCVMLKLKKERLIPLVSYIYNMTKKIIRGIN